MLVAVNYKFNHFSQGSVIRTRLVTCLPQTWRFSKASSAAPFQPVLVNANRSAMVSFACDFLVNTDEIIDRRCKPSMKRTRPNMHGAQVVQKTNTKSTSCIGPSCPNHPRLTLAGNGIWNTNRFLTNSVGVHELDRVVEKRATVPVMRL
jgi:hypothetical protein